MSKLCRTSNYGNTTELKGFTPQLVSKVIRWICKCKIDENNLDLTLYRDNLHSSVDDTIET